MAGLRHLLRSRNVGLLLCIIGFIWAITLINFSIISNSRDADPEQLKEDILVLSDKYVRALARDTRNLIDGPYTGRDTGYDLKKSMAVLLENILDRLAVLERQAKQMRLNGSAVGVPGMGSEQQHDPGDSSRQILEAPSGGNDGGWAPAENQKVISAKDLLLGVQEDCTLTAEEQNEYPYCNAKSAWMHSFWKSDPCYAENGVDGSQCSFRFYLSEVENWCPLIPSRVGVSGNKTFATKPPDIAQWNFNLDGLMLKLKDPGDRKNYEWIRRRIKRLWDRWVTAAQNLETKQPQIASRHRKRVYLHLGLLTEETGWGMAEFADKGGPLGELVQWSDIIAALYILGHDLTITSEVDDMAAILNTFPSAEAQCQTRTKLPLDMLYTDIVGLSQFKRKVRQGYGKFSCLLRIIDSFGTEAAFNHDQYAKANKFKTVWGMQNLNLQQFFTMFRVNGIAFTEMLCYLGKWRLWNPTGYPSLAHSPDNSFMGFIVEQHTNDSSELKKNVTKKNQAVVYGKDQRMWNGHEGYLSVIKKYVDIHGTAFVEPGGTSLLPSFVHNHGILPGQDLHQLLSESKLFIGLGFPYEGPAPLEAIAQGCVFINPKFNPPHSSLNTPFFGGKPTRRAVTSQHPYAEDFIGEPNVFTIDINNVVELEAAITKALAAFDENKVAPHLPYEYTHEGMLQRLSAYIQHQDFCTSRPETWPPLSAVNISTTQPGKSCKAHCWETNRQICEPSHFKRLNSRSVLQQFLGTECSEVVDKSDIYYPAFEPISKKCILQQDSLLFSCVGEVDELVRICPCRTYIKGQTALCPQCL